MRSGTPRNSQSLNLNPGVTWSRQSDFTLTPAAARVLWTASTSGATFSRSTSLRQIGTMTTCTGAMRGGSLNPLRVPVHHDERADQAGGHRPTRRPGIISFTVPVEKGHVECLRKVLSEVV